MESRPLRKKIAVEMYLFDTCTLKCGYCHLAETGKVLDNSQLRPYKDKNFVLNIAQFFVCRSAEIKWLVTLTGGEPLLMSNLPLFGDELAVAGNKLAFYTALAIGERHPSFRWLLEEGTGCTDYIMASFHAEAEPIEEQFFERIRLLKNAGHAVILRFVGHPQRLDKLNDLAERCQSLNIALYPTTLFAPNYPESYSQDQINNLSKHFSSLSQIIQLKNGLDTTNLTCKAGSELISIDMRTGNITPCITVDGPILGNIYDNQLAFLGASGPCPKKGISCSCDIHFQQDIVDGAHDSEAFEKIKKGYVNPIDSQDRMLTTGLALFNGLQQIGQTDTAHLVSLPSELVRSVYDKSNEFFKGDYSSANHYKFKSRQFPES